MITISVLRIEWNYTYLQIFIHPVLWTFPTKTWLLHSSKRSHLHEKKISDQWYTHNFHIFYLCAPEHTPQLKLVPHWLRLFHIPELQRRATIFGRFWWIYMQPNLQSWKYIYIYICKISPTVAVQFILKQESSNRYSKPQSYRLANYLFLQEFIHSIPENSSTRTIQVYSCIH